MNAQPTNASEWTEAFLQSRGLSYPDGRALYAYRCNEKEFASLAEILKCNAPDGNTEEVTIRAFVLYAAEWWQRKYDGRHWSWEPLLRSIEWQMVEYPDLYDPVRKAWYWWRINLVRLPSSIRYLGTFACQGGLPLALVGDADSRITPYLRAVLKHTIAYRKFVDDPIDLARDQQHLLRPPTLRRDYVFRLAADLIEAVLYLQVDAHAKNPLEVLDQVRPDWRDSMPLDLENIRARNLLTGLLREASRDTTLRTDNFRLDRFLRQTGIGWRLGARVSLPASISADNLAHQLNIPSMDLPSRLEVRVQGDRVRVVGLYAAQSDDYVLLRDKQSSSELWDTEAADEVRLQFLAGKIIGEPIVPYRGSALGELPWAFRGDDDEYLFIGEGTVSNRSSEIVALVPDGCIMNDMSTVVEVGVRVLNRSLWKIAELTIIETDNGNCILKPSGGQELDEEYRLTGFSFYGLECPYPLFTGKPTLRVAKSEQGFRAVSMNDVTWRQTGRPWQSLPDTYGLWEVRHVTRDGELRFLGRVGILPDRFSLSLEPGESMSEGVLILRGAEGVRISSHSLETRVSIRTDGNTVRVHVSARDKGVPPSRVKLRLHWQGRTALIVQAPFPGRGGRFLQDGEPLDGEIAVDELYGARASALSPDNSQCFWVEGELKASDLSRLLRVAHFRRPLRKSGLIHELPLIDARPMIELLLAASSSIDASVTLRIVDNLGREYGSVPVRRFVGDLGYDQDMRFISISPALIGETTVSCEALPIARPAEDLITLELVGPTNAPHGAVLPQNLDVNEPWLVVARHDDTVRVRPISIGCAAVSLPGVRNVEVPRLSEAVRVADPELRMEAIDDALETMLQDEETDLVEEAWSFLTDTLLRAEGLPATAIDLLKCLVKKPNLLVRCIFQLESAPRQMLWRLDAELPFSWVLIRRDYWWKEVKRACDRFEDQLVGIENGGRLAREHVCSILAEGKEFYPALSTVSTDVSLRLEGAQLSRQFVERIQAERDRQTPDQIRLRASMDDWPLGDCRHEWVDELGNGELMNELWQNKNEILERQPLFDTPVAAACCCFLSEPTERTIYLVKRIRAHDPKWFDIAYSAVWFRLAFTTNKLGEEQESQ